jgi:hypothetical protein
MAPCHPFHHSFWISFLAALLAALAASTAFATAAATPTVKPSPQISPGMAVEVTSGVADSFCRPINDARKKVVGAASLAGGAGGIGGAMKAVGLAAVEHSSGELIATYGGLYVPETLGLVGTAVSIVTSPAFIASGAALAGGALAVTAACYYHEQRAPLPPAPQRPDPRRGAPSRPRQRRGRAREQSNEATATPTPTAHARVRQQQRGVPPLIAQWLVEFGAAEHSHGAVQRYFDKRARRQLAQRFGAQVIDRLGDLMNCYAVEDDGCLITVGHRTRRIRRAPQSPSRLER